MLQWSKADSHNYLLWSLTGYLQLRLDIFPCPCPTCPTWTDRVCFKGLDTQGNKKSCISHHRSLACWCSLKFYLLHLWLNCNYCRINWVYRKNVFLGCQAFNFCFVFLDNNWSSHSNWKQFWWVHKSWTCRTLVFFPMVNGLARLQPMMLLKVWFHSGWIFSDAVFFADAGFIGKALQHNVELNPKYFLWNSCNFGRTKMCSHYDQRDKWNGKLVNSTRRWMKYQEMQQHWRIVELFRSWPPGGWSRCCCSGGLAHSRFLSFHFSGVKKSGGKKSPEESIVWVNPTHIANDKPWDWKPTEAAKNQKVKLSTTIWL